MRKVHVRETTTEFTFKVSKSYAPFTFKVLRVCILYWFFTRTSDPRMIFMSLATIIIV